MTDPTTAKEVHGHTNSWTALEDSDEATVRYSVCASLQRCIAILSELQLQSRHARWNAAGEDFRSLRMDLADIASAADDAADQVAERIRALDGVPDGRSESIAKAHSLAALPDGLLRTMTVLDLIVDRLTDATAAVRDVQRTTGLHDPPSSSLLNGIILELEGQRWKLRAAHPEL
jgi:starvation-inducible DNA-binding protein